MSGTHHNKLCSDIEPPSTPLLSSLLPSSPAYVLFSLHVQCVETGEHMSKQKKYTTCSTKLYHLNSVYTRLFMGPTRLTMLTFA